MQFRLLIVKSETREILNIYHFSLHAAHFRWLISSHMIYNKQTIARWNKMSMQQYFNLYIDTRVLNQLVCDLHQEFFLCLYQVCSVKSSCGTRVSYIKKARREMLTFYQDTNKWPLMGLRRGTDISRTRYAISQNILAFHWQKLLGYLKDISSMTIIIPMLSRPHAPTFADWYLC